MLVFQGKLTPIVCGCRGPRDRRFKTEVPKMDGLFHGKSQSEMDDDWGYPYDLGNHRMSNV